MLVTVSIAEFLSLKLCCFYSVSVVFVSSKTAGRENNTLEAGLQRKETLRCLNEVFKISKANKSSCTLYLIIYASSLVSMLLTFLLDSELLARARWCAQDANRTRGMHKSTAMSPRNGFNLVHMLPHQLVTSLGAGDDFTFAGLNTALKSLACHLNGTPKSAAPRPRVIIVISDGIDLMTQPFCIRICERKSGQPAPC